MKDSLYPVDFEKNNPNLVEKYVDNSRRSTVTYYYNPDDNSYYRKGLFGRWDTECYRKLDYIYSDQELFDWIDEERKLLKNDGDL